MLLKPVDESHSFVAAVAVEVVVVVAAVDWPVFVGVLH